MTSRKDPPTANTTRSEREQPGVAVLPSERKLRGLPGVGRPFKVSSGQAKRERDFSQSDLIIPEGEQVATSREQYAQFIVEYDARRAREIADAEARRLAPKTATRGGSLIANPADLARISDHYRHRDEWLFHHLQLPAGATAPPVGGDFCPKDKNDDPFIDRYLTHIGRVETRASALADERWRHHCDLWYAKNQDKIYRAANAYRPWYEVQPPYPPPTADQVRWFRADAEWLVATENNPDDPLDYLNKICLEGVAAQARNGRTSIRAARRDEEARLRAMLASLGQATIPSTAKMPSPPDPPTCGNPNGCPEPRERKDQRKFHNRCASCRRYRRRNHAERPAHLIAAQHERKIP